MIVLEWLRKIGLDGWSIAEIGRFRLGGKIVSRSRGDIERQFPYLRITQASESMAQSA